MASIEKFATPYGWKIKEWNGGASFPATGFVQDGVLLIGIAHQETPTCNLAWLDGNGKMCSITDLPFSDGGLKSSGLGPVHFGGPNSSIESVVSITLDASGVLTGTLDTTEVTGNTGTFTAEANPGPPAESGEPA